MELPFTTFQLGSPFSRAKCEIMATLDHAIIGRDKEEKLLLIRVVYDDSNPAVVWWIGGFAHEEGIGGRRVVSTNGIAMFHLVYRFFESEPQNASWSSQYDSWIINDEKPVSNDDVGRALKSACDMLNKEDCIHSDFNIQIVDPR